MMRRAIAVSVVLVGLAACSRSPYAQDTPDQTVQTAKLMVKNGEAKRLPSLILSESDDERKLYNRLGLLLGDLQSLATVLNEKFPNDVAQLKARAEEAAAKGKATSLIGELAQSVQPRGKRRRIEVSPKESSKAFNDAVTRLFADPYAFLADAEGKLTTTYLTDETAAILWDGKPVLPPIGLVLKQHTDKKWYIVPPSNLPGMNAVWPRTKKEFQLFDSILTVFDKTVVDLRRDVQGGRASSLDDVSRMAGEKAFAPAILVFYAYGQLKEAQKKDAAGVAPR